MSKKQLHIRDKKGTTNIEHTNIVRIEAKRSSCIVHKENGEVVLISKSLKKIVRKLGSAFVKVHRSHAINLYKILHYYKSKNRVEMDNGSIVPVSRTEKYDFIEAYNIF